MRKLLPLSCMVLIMLGSCQQPKSEVFEIASKEVNRQCPMIIDEVTTLDSTRYSKQDNSFIYYYTLTGAADKPEASNLVNDYLKQTIPEQIKTSREMETYRKNNVTIVYVYLSEKTQQKQLCLTITPDMYK